MSQATPIRVLIAEDHAIALYAQPRPDIKLMDLQMPIVSPECKDNAASRVRSLKEPRSTSPFPCNPSQPHELRQPL